MHALWQSFLLFLAGCTDKQLARHVEYLKAENRLLRSRLPKHIRVTPSERQCLLKHGRPVADVIGELISIVTPRTFMRWLQEDDRAGKRPARPARGPGAKPKPPELCELVLRLARENSWGYTRILGELRKLGITNISRSTVVNILKANGLDPGPRRGEDTWTDFVRRHAATLWATDFFSTKVWTPRGLVDVFVLFFIHVDSRRVVVTGVSANPDGAWMKRQATNFVLEAEALGLPITHLIRDRDTKFTAAFDELLADEGVEIKPVGPRAPNLNAYAERFVQSVKSECLRRFICCSEEHLRLLIREYLAHYHQDRPHQGLGNRPIGETEPPSTAEGVPKVACDERLGGLLKSYRRTA